MSFPPPPPRRNAPGATSPTSVPAPPPVDPDARAARRAEEGGSSRRRTALWIVASVAVVAMIVGGLVVALGGGGKELDTSTTVELELGEIGVESVATLKETDFPPEARQAVLATIGQYVDEGTAVPLRKRKADETKLAEIFDQAAVVRLAGTDRSLLLDEGLPKVVGKVTVTSPPVALIALSDANGEVLLVSAEVDFAVKARAQRGVITVQRTGTLVLTPQSDGSWKITGWTLHVERGGPGVAASPTAAPPTATTVP
ncbi:MAG: hypothetical protein WD598_09795 [Acidimicrobiia bacterium]